MVGFDEAGPKRAKVKKSAAEEEEEEEPEPAAAPVEEAKVEGTMADVNAYQTLSRIWLERRCKWRYEPCATLTIWYAHMNHAILYEQDTLNLKI